MLRRVQKGLVAVWRNSSRRFFSVSQGPRKVEKEEKNVFVEELVSALNFASQQNFEVAEEKLLNLYNQLEQDEGATRGDLYLILDKLGQIYMTQDNPEKVLDVMEKKFILSWNDPDATIDIQLEAFAKLIVTYWSTRPQKSLSLLKLVGSTEGGITQTSEFQLYAGTTYLLSYDERTADTLQSILQPEVHPTVRGCAYYNLALFKWLTTPREKRAPGDPKSKELETLEKEVIDLLRKAISSLEMLEIEDIEKYPRKETEKISPEEYQILDALLKRELKPEEMKSFQGDKIPLKNPLSSFACNMLAEVYLSMDKLDVIATVEYYSK
eukprot:TRINITY_DN2288_c0_g2_i3.p1 TRINITY_DN2288_c0_g2~~TRINITY_DN2288_c0_g2_i3.p1  ORF type:complete len:325 (+),score=70.10 TRINITY_DN2288_c0_g2_i3:159-1133(+)